jgi:sodium transport system ATP-binding protein
MIEALGIQKSFGPVRAVEGVSFVAPDGKITGLLGPNGAGKTTSLRMVYGLVRPDAGEVRVDGIVVSERPLVARQKLGALPDAHGLYPRLTARENIGYFGRLHGISGRALEHRVDELVDLLDMQDFSSRRVAGFSQGQRMKVSIARAIIHNPRNVILDEPTNGLDVMATRAMRTLILRMKLAGRCVLFSSHVMQEVAALCDHVVLVVAGRVAFEGTVGELMERGAGDMLEDAFVSVVEETEEIALSELGDLQ